MSESSKSRKPKGYWTYERCQGEALKYDTRTKFQNGSKGAYLSALKNGWLDDICSHMKRQGSRSYKFLYAYEFPKTNSVYVGLTYDFDDRHSRHLRSNKSPVYRHIKENNFNESDYNFIKLTTLYKSEVAGIKEQELELYYIKKGWNILNVAKCGSLGTSYIKWTYERCKEEASKYDNFTDFNRTNCFQAVRKYGWVDELTSHMKRDIKPNGYWTKERCKQEASKYDTITEFQRKCPGASKAVERNGWLEYISSHMVKKLKPNGYWTKERCKQEASKYKNRSSFYKGCSTAYMRCRQNKWLDDFFPKN